MKVLLDLNGYVFEYGDIEKGVFPEADPNAELYKVTNDKGTFYAVTNGFREVEVDSLPTEHDYHNYTYTESTGFVYHEPSKTTKDMLIDISNDIKKYVGGGYSEITDLQLAVVELYESLN